MERNIVKRKIVKCKYLLNKESKVPIGYNILLVNLYITVCCLGYYCMHIAQRLAANVL